MNYECHITVSTRYADRASVVARNLHWKTSEIARDPVLGDDTYFYLTTHASNPKIIFERMEYCTAMLRDEGVPIIREKVELIIHDTKTLT